MRQTSKAARQRIRDRAADSVATKEECRVPHAGQMSFTPSKNAGGANKTAYRRALRARHKAEGRKSS